MSRGKRRPQETRHLRRRKDRATELDMNDTKGSQPTPEPVTKARLSFRCPVTSLKTRYHLQAGAALAALQWSE